MKIQSTNTTRQTSSTKAKQRSGKGAPVFQTLMDEPVVQPDAHEQQKRGGASQHGGRREIATDDVAMLLLRQGIDVLDQGLAQIEREGRTHRDVVVSMGRVREQVRELRNQYGDHSLLDESETILAVETERLRQLG
ncbi:MAG: hypothetical protein Q9M26_05735 [Mariprofundales bacterium]|nr:hypothetical protein [Mariprofundales bacterium]